MRRVTTLALAAALGAPAAAAADPIPEGPPDSTPPPAFIGAPATQRPLFVARPPRHPFMAPNNRSNLHVDAHQTDSHDLPGPLGRGTDRISTAQFADCASLTFDSRGRIVTACVGIEGPTLYMLDPVTLDELASFRLPPRQPSPGGGPGIFQDFAGGGYFYLDHLDRTVIPTTNRHVFVIAERPGGEPGFTLERDYDVSGTMQSGDKIISALPDWSGRIWFLSIQGVVGVIEPNGGEVRLHRLGETVQNSFAVDERGAVYVVSEQALYRFDAAADGTPTVTWREVYANSGQQKPGQASAGSGTTPTVMEGGLVAITDNADPMNVVVYRKARRVRGARVVCEQPVFRAGESATDQSLIVAGRAIVVENNYGYTGPMATSDGRTTSPGLERVDLDPDGSGCRRVWRNEERAPSVVPKLSLTNGLVYTYTKDPEEGDADDPWYLTAIDFRTGRTVFDRLAGTGLGFNNNYAPVTIGPDGTAYVGVLGGLVALRDAAPPPGAFGGPPAPEPSLRLRTSHRKRRLRGGRVCAPGRFRASVAGPSRDSVRYVDFRLGRMRDRDRTEPFTRIIGIRPLERARAVTVRASARLGDGRRVKLRRRVLACPRR
jgi:outer membrane protein assembly factor BamB